jgi:hypothetical protein
MAPRHDQIIKKLDNGWSVVWDTTEIDATTRHAIDKVVKANTDVLKSALAESFHQAKLAGSAGTPVSKPKRSDRSQAASRSGSSSQPRSARSGRSRRAAA